MCDDVLTILKGVLFVTFLQVEFETEMMKDKRDKLTQLLMDLMERQKQRAEDLQVHFLTFLMSIVVQFVQRMMGEMETSRVEEQENYWLIQYQKLLDSKPKGLEEAEGSMDPKVKLMLIIIEIFTTQLLLLMPGQ